MCLLLTATSNFRVGWMQDIIFCTPGTAGQPGKKTIITTCVVNLRKPVDLVFYYSSPIYKGRLIDLSYTFKNDSWINDLTNRLRGRWIHYNSQRDVVSVKDGLNNPEEYIPTVVETASQFPYDDDEVMRKLKKAKKESPFTKIEIQNKASGKLIFRFGLEMLNIPEESACEVEVFRFPGPEILRNRMNSKTSQLPPQLRKIFTQASESLNFIADNMRYDLVIAFKNPMICKIIGGFDFILNQYAAIPSSWIDFEDNKIIENGKTFLQYFSSDSPQFNVDYMAKTESD